MTRKESKGWEGQEGKKGGRKDGEVNEGGTRLLLGTGK